MLKVLPKFVKRGLYIFCSSKPLPGREIRRVIEELRTAEESSERWSAWTIGMRRMPDGQHVTFGEGTVFFGCT